MNESYIERFKENIGLAISIASKFTVEGVDSQDILQEAYLGLWKACMNYDESKGYEFSTYATPTIRGYILRMLRDNKPIKTPRWFEDIRFTLSSKGFVTPLSEYEMNIIIAEGRFTREQLIRYSEYELTSLDGFTVDDKGEPSLPISETIADPSQEIDNKFSEVEINDIIDYILSYIKSPYRSMMRAWLESIISGDPLSQKELGEKYGFSQVYAGKIIRMSKEILHKNKETILSLFGY